MPCRLFDPKSFPEDSQVTCSFAQLIYNCNFFFFLKMCTLLVSLVSSTCLVPRTFTNPISTCLLSIIFINFTNLISIYMALAQNIHKSSQIMSLAQNIHKFSHSLFPCTVAPHATFAKFNHYLPETCYLYTSTVYKFQALLAHNICRCS